MVISNRFWSMFYVFVVILNDLLVSLCVFVVTSNLIFGHFKSLYLFVHFQSVLVSLCLFVVNLDLFFGLFCLFVVILNLFLFIVCLLNNFVCLVGHFVYSFDATLSLFGPAWLFFVLFNQFCLFWSFCAAFVVFFSPILYFACFYWFLWLSNRQY